MLLEKQVLWSCPTLFDECEFGQNQFSQTKEGLKLAAKLNDTAKEHHVRTKQTVQQTINVSINKKKKRSENTNKKE
jgi:hypothetical protein